jgi:hypothetical protein
MEVSSDSGYDFFAGNCSALPNQEMMIFLMSEQS